MTKERAIELLKNFNLYDEPNCMGYWDCDECVDAFDVAIEALQQEPIIHCKDCKYWHEWEHGAGSCHRNDIMWVGSDYCDYCSFAEE
jgi:hypothetical protein